MKSEQKRTKSTFIKLVMVAASIRCHLIEEIKARRVDAVEKCVRQEWYRWKSN